MPEHSVALDRRTGMHNSPLQALYLSLTPVSLSHLHDLPSPSELGPLASGDTLTLAEQLFFADGSFKTT